jgi:hypothetical protein
MQKRYNGCHSAKDSEGVFDPAHADPERVEADRVKNRGLHYGIPDGGVSLRDFMNFDGAVRRTFL